MLRGIKHHLTDWIIGKDKIPSIAEYKRVALTGYLALICIFSAVVYSTLDFIYQVYYSFPAYAVLFFMPALSLYLIRRKSYRAAKILLILSANLVVFWTALHDPFETGVFLFFIPTAMGSFAILDSKDTHTAVTLLGVTTFLFVLSYFSGFSFFTMPALTPDYIRITFVLNYTVSVAISVSLVYFLMKLHEAAEAALQKKELLANQQNIELRKVNSELDSFVYRVSHDLRSPLSSILGLTNLAGMTSDEAELARIHAMIRERINTQDAFIHDIMQYARNSRTSHSIEPVPLEPLINKVIDDLKFNVFASKIEFRKNINGNATVAADKMRLTIILNNLISNAIKYHDPGKPCPFIEIGYEPEQRMLYVKDNGIGIKQEDRSKIFQMFYRATDRSSGSGLGLFIAKEAAEKFGASIDVESAYGEGSLFRINLPEN